jgi:hypothetical protein
MAGLPVYNATQALLANLGAKPDWISLPLTV